MRSYRIVLFLLLIVWLSSVSALAQNLLDNPGFEQTTNHWIPKGGALLVATNASHSGARSLLVLDRTASSDGASQRVTGKLASGTSYFCSAWVRLNGASNQLVKLEIEQHDDAGNQVLDVAQGIIRSAGWTYVSGNFTLAGTGTIQDLLFHITGPDAGVDFVADDVVVAPLSGLRYAARATQVWMGGIIGDTTLANDKTFAKVAANDYHIAGCENALKFAGTEPGNNSYSFSTSDLIVNAAMSNGENSRGHTLVWHGSVPAWLSSGSFTATQLQAIVYSHIDTVVGHDKGKLFCWDAVNEAFNDNGTMRSTIFYDQPGIGYAGQGTKYLEEIYKRARAADPDVELIYNDYSAETINAKSSAIYNMAADFKNRGVPLDGIGFQMHLSLPGPTISSWRSNLQRFNNLGMRIQITEMDVRLPVDSSGAASPADLLAEANLYFNIVGAAMAFPALQVVQTWGFTDRYSWIPSFYPGFGAALPLDRNFKRKPAWWALHDVLANQAEFLPVFELSPGATDQVITNVAFSGGAARQLNANGTNDFFSLIINVPYPGQYAVRVGVRNGNTGAQFQLAARPMPTGAYSNLGNIQDTYSGVATYGELNFGTNTFDAAGDYSFRFLVAGKNANSAGYNLVVDYLRLTPSGADSGQAPSISNLFDQTMTNTGAAFYIPFTVSDRETVESALTIVTTTSNPTLLPGSSILLLGGGQNRVLSITPTVGQTGVTAVTVVALDTDGMSATNQFMLTVNPLAPPAVLLDLKKKGALLELNWPAAAGSWFLQTIPAFGSPAFWEPINDQPVLNGDTWSVVLPPSDQSGFFRLAQ